MGREFQAWEHPSSWAGRRVPAGSHLGGWEEELVKGPGM